MHKPHRLGRVAIIAVVVLLVSNVYWWVNNYTHLPSQMTLQVDQANSLSERVRQAKSFNTVYGCYYYLGERIGGASVHMADEYENQIWPLERISHVRVEPTSDLLQLDVSSMLAVTDNGFEELSCDAQEVYFSVEAGQDEYVWVATPTGTALLLPYLRYQDIIQSVEFKSENQCNLLKEEFWSSPESSQVRLTWTTDLAISIEEQVDRLYISTGGPGGFAERPTLESCPIEGGQRIALHTDVIASAGLSVSIFVIQYDEAGRLADTRIRPSTDPLTFIEVLKETTAVRFSLRLAGSGTAEIKTLRVATHE